MFRGVLFWLLSWHEMSFYVSQVDSALASPPPLLWEPGSALATDELTAEEQQRGSAGAWVTQTIARALNRAAIASSSKHEHCTHSTKTSSVPLCCPEPLPALRSRCPELCAPAMKGSIVMTSQQGKAKVPCASEPGFYVLRSVCLALC